jgi:alkylresorcinol/alkylpyrone synthase
VPRDSRAGRGASGLDSGRFVHRLRTPGLDVLVARDLVTPSSVERLLVGHMGCHAALPGLAAVADAAVARNRIGILACIELASVHAQPPSNDLGQIAAEALFADADAAVAVAPGRPGLEFIGVVARSDSTEAELMAWDITERGFRLRLSAQVAAVLSRHVASVVDELLSPHGLVSHDVSAWAVHPGGPRILDVVGERLGLDDQDLEVSRGVLRDYGNCSSATVLLILQRLLWERDLDPGDHIALLAFGPGLTLYGALLRVVK